MFSFAQMIMQAEIGRTWLFYAGQAGFIIKSASGQLLAIDLYLSDYVERLEERVEVKRLLPKILAPEDVTFDVIIATHAHPDHFDTDSMPGLMKDGKTVLFASEKCRAEAAKCGLSDKQVSYVSPGMTMHAGDFTIHFVSCDHGEGAPDAVGVIIEADGKLIYEAGDTCLRTDRAEEYRLFGIPDIMIAPINGAYGNMNESDCAAFSDAVKPELTIPCHYGMFACHGGDTGKFCTIMKEKYPDNKFYLMTMGEKLLIK